MVEQPQSFVVHEECQKAAEQNGFRRSLGETDGWAAFASTTAQSKIWLAASGSQGPWYLSLDHSGVVAELDLPASSISGPGLIRYSFDTLRALYTILPRLYQLAVSLPNAPWRAFQDRTASLPQVTEGERLVIQRIGQDIFRASLMEYWQGCCPLTGISDPALLRASHIVPWSECRSDAERLDVYNGLLLSALWDAAFDRALVTFDDEGKPVFSPMLGSIARSELRWTNPIPLTDLHRRTLQQHRQRFQT